MDRYPLDPTTLSQMKLSARHVKLQSGMEATELAVEMPDDGVSRKEAFWFDAHRGYGLVARRDIISIKGVEVRRITRRIDQLVEPLPGIFYPSSAEMYWEQRGTPVAWSIFVATRVGANEKHPDAFFKLEFPIGISITDYDKHGLGKKREEN